MEPGAKSKFRDKEIAASSLIFQTNDPKAPKKDFLGLQTAKRFT